MLLNEANKKRKSSDYQNIPQNATRAKPNNNFPQAPYFPLINLMPNQPKQQQVESPNLSELEKLKQLKSELLNQLKEKRKKKEIFQFTPIELFAVQEIASNPSGQSYLIVSLSRDNSLENYPNYSRIENISSNLASQFGYSPKQMIGSNLGDFFPQIKDENLNFFRNVRKKNYFFFFNFAKHEKKKVF